MKYLNHICVIGLAAFALYSRTRKRSLHWYGTFTQFITAASKLSFNQTLFDVDYVANISTVSGDLQLLSWPKYLDTIDLYRPGTTNILPAQAKLSEEIIVVATDISIKSFTSKCFWLNFRPRWCTWCLELKLKLFQWNCVCDCLLQFVSKILLWNLCTMHLSRAV